MDSWTGREGLELRGETPWRVRRSHSWSLKSAVIGAVIAIAVIAASQSLAHVPGWLPLLVGAIAAAAGLAVL